MENEPFKKNDNETRKLQFRFIELFEVKVVHETTK